MGCGAVYESLLADTSSLWTSSSKSTLYWRRQNALEEVATGMGSFSAFICPEAEGHAVFVSRETELPRSGMQRLHRTSTFSQKQDYGLLSAPRMRTKPPPTKPRLLIFSAAAIVAIPLAETIDTKTHNFLVQKSIALAYAMLKNQIAVISVSELLHILLQQKPPPTLSTVYIYISDQKYLQVLEHLGATLGKS